ncbi:MULTISPECIES: DoxX family protein [unclassified Leeuwenhoekiella]|uniref:DoxX family protein n=1 Tax=unclassified Leeuwenhoekiella TaxID=2615029 RepID=UPI000C665896|nr:MULTISPECIES: DoxX family protein [unclassified Leeuwenhoekiella]MAW96551.1 DoxX family protein [Leeuwenhoekiella sp.]MBA81438.1 DoxX family protein [Leeuwenhoekiella sp.]
MKTKIILVVSILFGLMFINSGLNKLFNYMPMPEDIPAEMLEIMGAFETIGWLMPLVAVVEIIGGVLVIFKPLRTLGALMLFPIMVGILLVHLVNEPSGLIIGLVFFAIELWLLYEGREKLKPLFGA